MQGLRPLLVAVAWCAAARSSQAENVLSLPSTWQDDQAHVVHLSEWTGKPVIMTMAYGTCRKVCSTSVRRMQEAQALADERGVPIEFVVVSLDPQADSPLAWHEFRVSKHLDRPNWHFLSGSPSDTRLLAHMLGIGYWVYDDHVVHDFRVVRLGPRGEVAAALTRASDPVDTLLLAHGAPSISTIEPKRPVP